MKNNHILLNHVHSIFDTVDMSKTLLIGCQHLLGTQYLMFEQLFKQNLLPEHCFIIGKNYSTNGDAYQMFSSLGCYVDPASIEYDPCVVFDEWFPLKLKAFLEHVNTSINYDSIDHIVILDDGGMLISEVFNSSSLPLKKVRAIEQTSSGWHRIKDLLIPFDVFSVARTEAKLMLETPHIAKLCFNRIVTHMKNRGLKHPKILVIGSEGYVGMSLSQRFLYGKYNVVGYDSKQGTLADVIGAELETFDVIVGATGAQSITREDIKLMKPSVSLISVSSSDREFPVLMFRTIGTIIHQDHFLGERCLVNGGFPITFYGNYHELAPELIEITCALLLYGVFKYSLSDSDERYEYNHTVEFLKEIAVQYREQTKNVMY